MPGGLTIGESATVSKRTTRGATKLRGGFILVLSAAGALLAGCAANVSSTPPDLSLGENFVNAPVAGPVAGPVAELPQAWWTTFNDPQLTKLIETALKDNLTIEIAAARLEQAAFGVAAARAQLGPQISGDAQAAVQRLSLEDPQLQLVGDLPGFDRVVERYGLSAGASWEIDLFGRLRAQKREAVAQFASAKAQREFAKLSIAAEVALTYFAVTELKERIDITQRQIAVLDDLDRLTRLTVERGLAAPLQSDRTTAELEGLRAVLPALQTEFNGAQYRLSVLLGESPRAALLGEDGLALPNAPAFQYATTPAQLLRGRPDIVAVERQIAAASAGVQKAIAERYPRLSIAGFVGFLAGDAFNLFGNRSLQAGSSADVSVPLFTSGQLKAGEGAARARLREALAQYRLTALSAIAEVETALLGYEKQRDQLAAITKAASALDDATDRSRLAYRAGVIDLIDVLDVERRALETRERAIIAKADLARRALDAFRSLGGGYSAPG
ncbi:MAG: TolC family protein [Pseudomonadota bacterium]